MRIVLLLISCFLAGLHVTCVAQEIPAPVSVKLVSGSASVKPGEVVKLGILFEIDPGWHIYSRRPGRTGLPTRIEYTLPGGFELGETRWPEPEVFQSPDGVKESGYEKSLLLSTEIKVPSNNGLDPEVVVGVLISWLSCKEICIPGTANLDFELEIDLSGT